MADAKHTPGVRIVRPQSSLPVLRFLERQCFAAKFEVAVRAAIVKATGGSA